MLSRRAHTPARIAGLLGLGLLCLLSSGSARAQVSLFANQSEWVIDDDGGTDTETLSGICDGSPGFTVADAFLDGLVADAYDFGQTVWIDDVQFMAEGTTKVGARTVSAGPLSMSGLAVSVQYAAMESTATLRTLIGFSNPSGDDIVTKVQLSTNVTTDAQTFFGPTSSGDNNFNIVDRWVMTRRNVTPLLAPVITHVNRGVGGVVPTATSVSTTSFQCPATQAQGITVTFDITVPAGETRYLLFFNSLAPSLAAAQATAKIFASPPPHGDLLFGLLPEQLLSILNWKFEAACRDAKKQSLVLKAKDHSMSFRWNRGQKTTIADFGDPLERSTYFVCLVDYIANLPFIESCSRAPAGTLGWRTKGNGYKYRMKDGEPDGLTRLKLRRGEENRAKIKATGEEMVFDLPLEQDPEVRVLVTGNNICWQGRFLDGAKKNDADTFKAKQKFHSGDEEDDEEVVP